MSEQQQKSEVARLRAQIDAEYQSCMMALQGLSSGNLQHAFIYTRMYSMDQSYKELEHIIGEDQATDIVCEVFNQTPNRLLADEHTSTRPCCSDERSQACQQACYDVYQAHQSGLLSQMKRSRGYSRTRPQSKGEHDETNTDSVWQWEHARRE